VPHPIRLQSVASGTFMDLNGGSPNDGIKNIASGLLTRNWWMSAFTGTQILGWERLSNNNQLWAFRSVTISGSNINNALKANQFINQTFPSYLRDTKYDFMLSSPSLWILIHLCQHSADTLAFPMPCSHNWFSSLRLTWNFALKTQTVRVFWSWKEDNALMLPSSSCLHCQGCGREVE